MNKAKKRKRKESHITSDTFKNTFEATLNLVIVNPPPTDEWVCKGVVATENH